MAGRSPVVYSRRQAKEFQSEHDGKAFFPTIPRFTYGEQIEFRLPGLHARPALNYSAFAWAMNGGRINNEELHSENGYLSVSDNGHFSLSTVMSNGNEVNVVDNQSCFKGSQPWRKGSSEIISI